MSIPPPPPRYLRFLLLGRMVEAHEIGHPARGYYIAHKHHSLDTPGNQLPTTTDTINTINTTDSPTQQHDNPSTIPPP